jgi:hypothetical protein
MKTRQKTKITFKARLIIGTSCCLLIACGIFISINVSNVNETYAGVSGDYRSISNGNWEDTGVWEMYDGKHWQAPVIPPMNTSNVFIKSGTEISVNREASISEITIEENATLKLNSESFHINKEGTSGNINVKGRLNLGHCIIDGKATFNLRDNAELIIGSPDGLSKTSESGNIRVNGTHYFSSYAHYTYSASEKQHTGKGLPFSVSQLTIDNPAGLELEGNLIVTALLHLSKGILSTGSDTLIIGVGKNSNGTVTRENGGVAGNFKRWLGSGTMKEALFPLMETDNYNAIYISVNSTDYSSGTFTFCFIPEKINKKASAVNGNTRIIAIGETGYYKVSAADGFEGGVYKLVASVGVSAHENKSYWMMNAKPVDDTKMVEPIEEAAVEELTGLVIAPNPFKERFTAKFNLTKESEIEINLLNASGQLVLKDKIQGQQSENTYEYNDQRNLPVGNYMFRIIVGDKIETRKLIKQ